MRPTWTGTCRALGATRAGVCGGFQKVGCRLDSSQTRRACLPHTRPGQVTVPQAPRGPCTQVAAVHLGQWACSSPRRGALSSGNPRPFTKRRSWSAALKATLFQSPRAAIRPAHETDNRTAKKATWNQRPLEPLPTRHTDTYDPRDTVSRSVHPSAWRRLGFWCIFPRTPTFDPAVHRASEDETEPGLPGGSQSGFPTARRATGGGRPPRLNSTVSPS